MYSNLAMMAVLFLGILPEDKLPDWISPLRVVLPSTYAVEALKPGLDGAVGTSLAGNLAVLALFGAILFWAVRGPLWPHAE
ncbi:MAG: ABC transporter permease [Actinobacteria bacterium]|nr:ABC transporter permease [Actinomycetota bacterium]